jgi:hypothetical protein
MVPFVMLAVITIVQNLKKGACVHMVIYGGKATTLDATAIATI